MIPAYCMKGSDKKNSHDLVFCIPTVVETCNHKVVGLDGSKFRFKEFI